MITLITVFMLCLCGRQPDRKCAKLGKNQHQYEFSKESLILVEGVVPGIGLAIQALTKENDAVLINTPVYPPFARTVKLNNRKLVENALLEKNGEFLIDFKNF